MKKEKKNNYIKYIFIIFSIMFAVPSIIYYINNKTILGFDKEFRFLLNDAHKIFQTFVFNNRNDNRILFNNKEQG